MRTTGAYILRENTGTSGLEQTLRSAVEILARHGVLVNLLPAGRVLKRGCKVPFPNPPEVWDQPRFVSLEKLLSLKLDSWSNSPNLRLKDKADVIELIKAQHLPRELAVDEAVRALYRETWDALAAEH